MSCSGSFLALALTFLLLSFEPTAHAKLFQLVDSTSGQPCLLADIDFSLSFTAEADGEVVGPVTVSSDDEEITTTGSCGDISATLNLGFPQSVYWNLRYTQDEDGEVTLDRLVQFVPKDIFGEDVPDTDLQLWDDPGTTSLGDSTLSYYCDNLEETAYQPIDVSVEDFNFTVIATVEHIQTQAFNIEDGQFSDTNVCAGPGPGTSSTAPPPPGPPGPSTSTAATTALSTEAASTAAITTTTTENITTEASTEATTEAYTTAEGNTTEGNSTELTTAGTTAATTELPTTLAPEPIVQLYTVTEGNVTCITFEGAVALVIEYPLTGGGTAETQINVPEDSVGNGNCTLTDTSQELNIFFNNGWVITFIFDELEGSSSLSSGLTATAHPAYELSTLEVTFTVSRIDFPGTSWEIGSEVTANITSSSLPQVGSDQGYYKCNSTLVMELDDTVSVQTQNLFFMAFNGDDSEVFSGEAAVCAADIDSSSSNTVLIICVVIGVIILLCLIAFIVMYVLRKRRNANYQAMP